MRIRKIVLMAIKGDTGIRTELKKALGISEPTLYKLLTNNHDDLTKAAALKVIRDGTGLTDAEILEDVELEVSAEELQK